MGMLAIIPEPVFPLVDGVLELCFPRTQLSQCYVAKRDISDIRLNQD